MSDKTRSILMLGAVVIAMTSTLLASQGIITATGMIFIVMVVLLLWGSVVIVGAVKNGVPLWKAVLAFVGLLFSNVIIAYLIFAWRDRIMG